jgi:hypothetical protein
VYFRVIYRDGFLTSVSLFRTVLFWPTSPTPRLPRLPSERDKHVLERAASWEDVERYQGRFLDIWQIETWAVHGLLYKKETATSALGAG